MATAYPLARASAKYYIVQVLVPTLVPALIPATAPAKDYIVLVLVPALVPVLGTSAITSTWYLVQVQVLVLFLWPLAVWVANARASAIDRTSSYLLVFLHVFHF